MHAVGYLEKRSIAAKKNTSLPFHQKLIRQNQYEFLDSVQGKQNEIEIAWRE